MHGTLLLFRKWRYYVRFPRKRRSVETVKGILSVSDGASMVIPILCYSDGQSVHVMNHVAISSEETIYPQKNSIFYCIGDSPRISGGIEQIYDSFGLSPMTGFYFITGDFTISGG